MELNSTRSRDPTCLATTREDFDCCCASKSNQSFATRTRRVVALSFGDNPRPKLAGLLPPKTGPRPRDCRDYAAVTHVARVRSIAPATCKYRYYRVLRRVYASCVKEQRRRRRRRRHLVDRAEWICRLNHSEGREKSSFALAFK